MKEIKVIITLVSADPRDPEHRIPRVGSGRCRCRGVWKRTGHHWSPLRVVVGLVPPGLGASVEPSRPPH